MEEVRLTKKHLKIKNISYGTAALGNNIIPNKQPNKGFPKLIEEMSQCKVNIYQFLFAYQHNNFPFKI